jgi:outer membrane protein assembly factor BamB
MGRWLCAMLLLGVGAAAGEPDGAIAEAARWTEPRGCASGSFRSRARPVVTEIEEAWRLELARIAAPPVHWDGTAYVVGYADRKAVLVAIDLDTGKVRARTRLKGYVDGSGLSVWDNTVFVQPTGDQINGYRMGRGSLKPVWIFRGRKYGDTWRHPRLPIVHDNEVYCFLGNCLARLRPGSTFPVWIRDDSDEAIDPNLSGRPAVFGRFVFVATVKTSFATPTVYLYVYRRSDGERVTRFEVCEVESQAADEPFLQLTVTDQNVHIGSAWSLASSGGSATHAMVPLKVSDEKVVRNGEIGLASYEVAPAHHPGGSVVLAVFNEELRWARHRGRKFFELTRKSAQPDLFRDRVSPTVLGDIVYFGSWAMDIETNEILWRLPFQNVTYPVVAADGLILVVESGKVLRAFRGRGKK